MKSKYKYDNIYENSEFCEEFKENFIFQPMHSKKPLLKTHYSSKSQNFSSGFIDQKSFDMQQQNIGNFSFKVEEKKSEIKKDEKVLSLRNSSTYLRCNISHYFKDC